MEKYKIQIVGLLLAVLSIIIGVIFLGIVKPDAGMGFLVYTMVGSRIIFWVFTDVLTDKMEFNWNGSVIKLRGLLALGSLMILLSFNSDMNLLVGSLTIVPSMLFFIFVFRLIGGVGNETRNIISGLLDKRIRWVVNLI